MPPSIERVWQDLRHGVRVFARNPALTAICVLSIAFGSGANVAIFSMADALLLRPLPVADPSEIVTVGSRVMRGTIYQNYASYPGYIDLRDRTQTLEGLAVAHAGIVLLRQIELRCESLNAARR